MVLVQTQEVIRGAVRPSMWVFFKGVVCKVVDNSGPQVTLKCGSEVTKTGQYFLDVLVDANGTPLNS